jgi:hypothetical protein
MWLITTSYIHVIAFTIFFYHETGSVGAKIQFIFGLRDIDVCHT